VLGVLLRRDRVKIRFRPFSAFLLDTLTVTGRRSWQVAVICVLGWAPAAAALWMLLTAGVRVPSFTELLSIADTGPVAGLPQLLLDRDAVVLWGALLAATVVLGQVLVTGALTHQLFHAAAGSPAGPLASLARSATCLHRTLPAALVLLVVIASPLAAGSAAAGWMLWMDPTGWQEPARTGVLVGALVGVLALWAAGRLALWPAAAVLAPRRTFTLRVALRASARHWWQVVLRLLVVTAVLAAVCGALATPLAMLGVTGSASVVALTLTARAALSMISGSLAASSAALVYADADAPADGVPDLL
jgi:hypothetical protein